MGCLVKILLSILASLLMLVIFPVFEAAKEYPNWGKFMLAVISFLVIAILVKRCITCRILKVRHEEFFMEEDRKRARKMCNFLNRHKSYNPDRFYSLDIKENDVVDLIRIANRLGCEVIIRKVADYDTEDEKYTPELFDAIIKRMKEKEKASQSDNIEYY